MKNKKILLALTAMLITTPLINTYAMDETGPPNQNVIFNYNNTNNLNNYINNSSDNLKQKLDIENINNCIKDLNDYMNYLKNLHNFNNNDRNNENEKMLNVCYSYREILERYKKETEDETFEEETCFEFILENHKKIALSINKTIQEAINNLNRINMIDKKKNQIKNELICLKFLIDIKMYKKDCYYIISNFDFLKRMAEKYNCKNEYAITDFKNESEIKLNEIYNEIILTKNYVSKIESNIKEIRNKTIENYIKEINDGINKIFSDINEIIKIKFPWANEIIKKQQEKDNNNNYNNQFNNNNNQNNKINCNTNNYNAINNTYSTDNNQYIPYNNDYEYIPIYNYNNNMQCTPSYNNYGYNQTYNYNNNMQCTPTYNNYEYNQTYNYNNQFN